MEKEWHTAYIALGSNMGDRMDHLSRALKLMDASEGCRVSRVSSIYETEPYGNTDQDRFLNGAAEVRTVLSPGALMNRLLEIEAELKRERTVHWGPRTIDLDILFYDDIVSSDPHVIIPHPGIQDRLFVLRPLCDIAPRYIHPLLKKQCDRIAESLKGEQEEPRRLEEGIDL
ncbi:2-amino-4-hydroxy-6-hydroxymethyldihydropteridine diphosphokinase [Spirochaeta isovalerica]|uniref:2-amino-4-hydroxy-6-hydroxymethyldihydropteridine pyrophosphokinase n=1 Tax=Spirochaeta isovalerica TaxID=150 RepID=A0A841RAP1_9SPIO|nr:2-amino-4-hydroxy-6-hydroxymethyldihydropteridine diphosphokinase [Spirochaeta isovalerica]MBB6479502.1 dihydroneopterin aldolase/2-amino-4-hydroxy-6-hydroxymethyldihydropteridine diphosphokinase [Spirochaeta isovalerica]